MTVTDLNLCGVKWRATCPALLDGVHVCGEGKGHDGSHQCVACLEVEGK